MHGTCAIVLTRVGSHDTDGGTGTEECTSTKGSQDQPASGILERAVQVILLSRRETISSFTVQEEVDRYDRARNSGLGLC